MFSIRSAKRAVIWPLIPAAVSALAGNFEGMAGLLVVATPIFFVVGGVVGGLMKQTKHNNVK